MPASIPLWFRGAQRHGRYKYLRNKKVKTNERSGRPSPATAIFSWKSSPTRKPIIFGSFDRTDSICRARPSLMSQHMTFDIDVREGQDKWHNRHGWTRQGQALVRSRHCHGEVDGRNCNWTILLSTASTLHRLGQVLSIYLSNAISSSISQHPPPPSSRDELADSMLSLIRTHNPTQDDKPVVNRSPAYQRSFLSTTFIYQCIFGRITCNIYHRMW